MQCFQCGRNLVSGEEFRTWITEFGYMLRFCIECDGKHNHMLSHKFYGLEKWERWPTPQIFTTGAFLKIEPENVESHLTSIPKLDRKSFEG